MPAIQALLFIMSLMLHLASGAGELKILGRPKTISPFIPMNFLLTRTDTYKYNNVDRLAEIDELSDLKVTVYNEFKNMTLPQYKVEGQDKTFLKAAPGDMWQARYIGYFVDMPKEKITLKFRYNKKKLGAIAAGWIEVFSDPFHVSQELTIAYFRPESTEKELNDKMETVMEQAVARLNKNAYASFPFQSILPGWKVLLKTYAYSTDDTANLIKVR